MGEFIFQLKHLVKQYEARTILSLDELLTQLDDVLADVDSAMQEGDDQ